MDINAYSKALMAKEFDKASEIRRASVPNKVCKFVPLGHSDEEDLKRLAALKARELWFSPVGSYNDPYEFKGLYIDDERLRQSGYTATGIANIHKTFSVIGMRGLVCCFSAGNYQEAPMWAYYANNAQGFCVEYTVVNKASLQEVQYASKPCDVTGIATDLFNSALKDSRWKDSTDSRLAVEILLLNNVIKHKSWRHEREYRIVIPGKFDRGLALPLEDAGLEESKILIGISCSPENEAKLREIGDELKVPVNRLQATKDSYFAEEKQ